MKQGHVRKNTTFLGRGTSLVDKFLCLNKKDTKFVHNLFHYEYYVIKAILMYDQV